MFFIFYAFLCCEISWKICFNKYEVAKRVGEVEIGGRWIGELLINGFVTRIHTNFSSLITKIDGLS